MKINAKKNMLTLLICALFSVFCLISAGLLYAEEIEEAPNMTMPGDNIITGEMTDYSDSSIVVDYIRYSLCSKMKVFNPSNRLMNYKDIDAAIEVKLFESKGCVRKIKVLSLAQ